MHLQVQFIVYIVQCAGCSVLPAMTMSTFLVISGIVVKKSRIRETKNFSTDADSRTDTITFFHQEIAGDGRVLIEETEF